MRGVGAARAAAKTDDRRGRDVSDPARRVQNSETEQSSHPDGGGALAEHHGGLWLHPPICGPQ